MVKIKININYKRKAPTEAEKKDWLSDSELSNDYINYAVRAKYPSGLKGISIRIFARIQNKIDDAIIEKKDFIELEKAEMDFMKEVFKSEELSYPVQIVKHVVLLLDEVSKALDIDIGKEKEEKEEEIKKPE